MDSYYKFATAFFITKCDTVYDKLRQVLQSAMDLLQIATVQKLFFSILSH